MRKGRAGAVQEMNKSEWERGETSEEPTDESSLQDSAPLESSLPSLFHQKFMTCDGTRGSERLKVLYEIYICEKR